ncbi:uncharacterized protein LOC106064063 [Biomphalaria glabrata]|uniref:Uncharacterized protein LOC106064063 n=1 Tax=Biomphalaria glabrata TaxID=6526 RepID=A0A9U8E957_BIOGL|nr:uncharacterized protein LOC106064063 [Biomphalaria glabrata]
MTAHGFLIFVLSLCVAETKLVGRYTRSETSASTERLDCKNKFDCSMTVNNISYECNIGAEEKCVTFNWKNVDHDAISTESIHHYPYLSTVSIELKLYTFQETRFEINVLKFAFQLPQLSFGQGGVAQAVMAVLHNTGSSAVVYTKPTCRIFDFSSSTLLSSDVVEQQNLTVPSECLGVDIAPGNYTLDLTTIPTNHSLLYKITWPRDERDMDEDVWVQKLIAVAAVPKERMVHVVFHPLKNVIAMVRVSLMTRHRVVKTETVLKGQTSVMFKDVADGQYRVLLSPMGNVCDKQEFVCAEEFSDMVTLDNSATPVAENYLILVIILVVLSPLFLLLMIFCLYKHLKPHQGNVFLCINAVVTRKLEERISTTFSNLLTELLHAEVDIRFSYPSSESSASLADQQTSLIDPSEDVVDVTENRERRKHHYKIYLFFPSTVHCLNGSWYSKRNCSSKKQTFCGWPWTSKNSGYEILTVIFSHQPTTSETICEDLSSDGHLTVLDNFSKRRPPLSSVTPSLHNMPGLVNNRLQDEDKVFYLPKDIKYFLTSFRFKTPPMASAAEESDHWKSVVSMFSKIAENQPVNDPDIDFSVITITDIDELSSVGQNTIPSRRIIAGLVPLEKCSEFSESYSNVSDFAREIQNTRASLPYHSLSQTQQHCLLHTDDEVIFRSQPAHSNSKISASILDVLSPERTETHILRTNPQTRYYNHHFTFQPDSGQGDSFGSFQNISEQLPVYPDNFLSITSPHILDSLDKYRSFQPDSGQGISIQSFQNQFQDFSSYPADFVRAIIPPEPH